MFQTIKNLWRRDDQPESWKVAAASAMKMEMGVESLETRIMLAGNAVVDDLVDHVQPEFAPQIAAEIAPQVAEASAEATNVEFAPETISLRKVETPSPEASDNGDTNDGNDQSLVLNLNETSVLSVSQNATDSVADSATDFVANDDVEVAIEDAQLIQTEADNVVSNVAESTVRLSRSAPLTAPEQGVNHVADDLKIDAESDAGAYEFEFLEGHETRGPPAAAGDSTTATSVLTLHAPLSSNASDNTTYDASSCPETDGSHAVCSHGTLLLGENDTLGGHQTIGQSVLNNGLVSPGNSPGILNIDGDFAQSSDGTLLIEIEGLDPGLDGHDQINVDGDVTLDGLLQVLLDSDFAATLADGNEIVFLTYTGTLTGDFANVSGLGIPGTSLFLQPEHDADNNRYILRVVDIAGSLTDGVADDLRDGIDRAAERLAELGARIQSSLDFLRQPLPIVDSSLFDLIGNSTEQRFDDFFDFSDEIEQFSTTANSTLNDLQSLVNGKINELFQSLSGTPVGNIATYFVTIDGRDELHVEFVIDWEQVINIANLDLASTLSTETLSQLGLEFNGQVDLDVTLGFAARFGIVVDVTTPGAIDGSKIAIELSQLEISAEVVEPVTGVSVDLNSIGSGIGINDGEIILAASLAVSLSQLDNANRINLNQLDSLYQLGFAASIAPELAGILDIELPLDVSLGGTLLPFGQPIVRIQGELNGDTENLQAETSVSVDLDITAAREELLGLLAQIQDLRPSLDDLPFPVPASFGLEALFDQIGGLLTLQPDAENYFNAVEAFQLDIDTELATFRTLLGLAADFDDVTDASDLATLVGLLTNEFAIDLAVGLTFEEISAAVVDQLGSFATMGGLVAHLVNTRELTLGRSLFGITFDFTGGYDPSARELFLNVKADFSGSQTFTDVSLRDLTGAIATTIDGLRNDPTFRAITGTDDLADSTGLSINEDSLAIAFDSEGNPIPPTDIAVDTVEFVYNSTLDVTIGLSIGEIADGAPIDADVAFLRINDMSADVSMTFEGASMVLSIDGPGGSLAAVVIQNASFHLSGGVSLISDPVTVTLADILGGVSLTVLVNSLDVVTQGTIAAELPLSIVACASDDGCDSADPVIDTAEFGTPSVLIDDENIFDDQLPEIRVNFILGPTLQAALLDLTGHWDNLISGLLGSSALNTSLPLVGQSVVDLLGGNEGEGIESALLIQSVLADYFATPEPTVEGLIELLTETLNARLAQLAAGLPFDVSGGLVWPDFSGIPNAIFSGGPVFSLDFGIDVTQSFGLNVDIDSIGGTQQILDSLSDLGVELTSDFLLAVDAILQGEFTLRVDVSDLIQGPTTLTSDDFSIEFTEPLFAQVDVDVSDLNLGVDFSAIVPGLAPAIESGSLNVQVSGQLGLTGTATENVITVAEITDGTVAEHIEVTVAGSLAATLPITGLVEVIPTVTGSFVLRISNDDVFDAATPTETIIDAELAINEFVYLRGSITGFIATTHDVTLVDGSTKSLDLITIGIGDTDLFIGTGGPTNLDLDGNGTVDENEINDDAVGLVVDNANVAIAIFTPTDATDTNRYIAVGATATSVSTVGLPNIFALTLTDVEFLFNSGTDSAVDFMATDFGDGVGAGLMVATGAAPFVLDMDAAILRASANVELNLGGFVLVTGTFAFSVEEGEVVTDDTGVAKRSTF